MYEVELKVRADHETVLQRLDELDADRENHIQQEDTYYDAPHRDFTETDEALRIRRVSRPDDDYSVERVTYKGPLLEAESKSREEFETRVEDGDTMAEILQRLGFSPAATVTKERTEFAFDGYTITLDRVEGLGEFVEVETETESADIETAREGAWTVLDRLDLDPDEQIRTSYLGLLLADE
ncbi:class IV adenylate cyclase [Natranaeroarchaeum aerophilus]|uniref:Class IV adenylate cyclase n=1 Tax=Natranaeroarchaeum aerophilus TaxID=2917711 RepID=A0AAE3K450_9EURY|nr:class IV adenylate cyclase [Natranaeroarchaeum aerophilus]MCL9813162.1 class IV adenylate cyclase [Natranaeroarchaeum aerophilus]